MNAFRVEGFAALSLGCRFGVQGFHMHVHPVRAARSLNAGDSKRLTQQSKQAQKGFATQCAYKQLTSMTTVQNADKH